MFISRPQTTHVPRHYSSLNTVKKTQNRDKENLNAGGIVGKTPSRVGKGGLLVPNTTRPLGKVDGKIDGKGKGKDVDDIGPKRLFASTSHSIIPSKSFGNLQSIRSTKTPAKTRPAQVTVKQFTTPLPSASKPRRSRQSLTPLVPPVPQFSTPAPKGKEWEEGESLDSITEGLNELAVSGLALGQIGELEENDGEVEYAPPRSIPLPHIPIGAIDCIADDLEVFRRTPVLYPLHRKEVMPPPELEEIRFELGRDMIGTRWSGSAWAGLMIDDVDLEEPMFRTAPSAAPLPTTRPAGQSRPAPPTSTRTALRPVPSTSDLRSKSVQSRLGSTLRTRTVPTRPPPTVSKSLSTQSRATANARVPAPSARLVKPPPPAPAREDLSQTMEDLPVPELPLDFGFDDVVF